MRHLMSVNIACASLVLSAGTIHADLGDQLYKLLPSDGAADDLFGISTAVDGSTAIVGAIYDDDNGYNSGSAYLYDTTAGTQLFKLLPDDGAVDDRFGASVAISGTTAIVGSKLDDDNGLGSGSAYLFDTTTGQQTFKLLPTDGTAGEQFGVSVAISGTTAIVGCYGDDYIGFWAGSAYLFDTTTGVQIAKLIPTDGAAGEYFGISVAISGTTAIVGSGLDDDNGLGSGSAYLFDTTSGTQLFKLLPTDGAADDWFGVSVAIDGTTAIAGAIYDDDNGSDTGSAYLFDTTTGQQLFKLLADDAAADDRFGGTVAVSGTTAIVGAYFDDDSGTDSGSAYFFDCTTGTQVSKALPDDGSAEDQFGVSVAIHGTNTIIGAYADDDNGTNSGSAYLFDSSTGLQTVKLLPSDGAADDLFGISTAVDGSTAIVGAIYDDDNGYNSGSAYLYDTTAGTQLFKLLPDDGAVDDRFGASVAISGTTAIVGSKLDDDNGLGSGSAYLFDTTTGQQTFKLLPTDGTAGEQFGVSVAISGTTAIVGCYGDDYIGFWAGSAYLFDTTTGVQIAKLIPTDGAAGEYFGISVAISGTTAIVGSGLDDDNGLGSGSAYLFDTTSGTQLFKLLPTDGAADDWFGVSVAIDGTTAIAGAIYDDDNGSDTGSAYLFDTTTGQQLFKLLADDAAADDRFGGTVAVSGTTAIVGAYFDDDSGTDSGSAYFFDCTTGTQVSKALPDDGAGGDLFGISVALSGTTAIVGAYLDDDNGADSGSAYVFDATIPVSCLDLVVENLVAGERATFTIANGTPGAKGVTVYGTKPGETSVNDYAGYCATFGINGVNQNKVLGGLNKTFDANGEITFGIAIPGNAQGLTVYFQSAMRGTCPDECMSNLVEAVVQ